MTKGDGLLRPIDSEHIAEGGIVANRLSRDYGYTAGGDTGVVSAVTEKYDDVANAWTAKTNMNTARSELTGFNLNGYGYTAGGYVAAASAVVETFDDVANTWTVKTDLSTARNVLAGFSLNGYGYAVGGLRGEVSIAVEKYDDVANTWTSKNSINTAKEEPTGFSLNGYGYVPGGNPSTVNKYDDVADAWAAKTNLNTARKSLAGFSLNGYGYAAGGDTGVASTVTEKYNDVADTWTAKDNLNTASKLLSGFSLNGYGYIAGGDIGESNNVTEKYDDVENTWTTKSTLNTGRKALAGFGLGAIRDGVQNPCILPILRHIHNIEKKYYGEAYIYNNAVDTVIETVDTPIALRQITEGENDGFTFDSGSTGTITAYADYGATVTGTVLVTSAGHGLSTGDIITIRGTSNYNGVFIVTYVGVDTFYITDTWAVNDGASDWDKGASLTAESGTDGMYVFRWQMSTGPTAACDLIWVVYVNTTPNVKCVAEREYPVNDIGSASSGDNISISAGDVIWLSVQSDNTADILNKHGNFNLHKL